MCELFFMIKKEINDGDVSSFEEAMQKGSSGNKDGWGIFTNLKSNKSFNTFKCFNSDIAKDLTKDAKFIVGHLRNGTSGKQNMDNTHPINIDGLWLSHNGILSSPAGNETYSDTYMFTKEFADSCKKNSTLEAFDKTISGAVGTYAMFFYNKKDKKLYFAKNASGFKFHLVTYGNEEYIIGSTVANRFERKEYRYGVFAIKDDNFKVISTHEPIDNVVYEIDYETMNITPLIEVKTIEKYRYATNKWSGNQQSVTRPSELLFGA